MSFRVANSKNHDVLALLSRLADSESGKEQAVFETKQKLLVFAAAIGMSDERKVPLENRDMNTIRNDVFENAGDSYVVDLSGVFSVAGADGDLAALSDDNVASRVKAFEEYANSGLHSLRGMLNDSDSLSTLAGMIADKLSEEQDELLDILTAKLPGSRSRADGV
jgi:dnd system-associated protein 4